MRAPFLFGLSLVWLVAAAAGCGETFVASGSGETGGRGGNDGGDGPGAGGHGGGAGAGGGQTTATPTETGPLCTLENVDSCGACLLAECEVPVCECLGNAKCVDLGKCVSDLGKDPPWENLELCWQYHKAGIGQAGRLQACGSEKCPKCDYEPVGKCLACQYEHCSAPLADCLANYKCTGFLACLAQCPEGDCDCYTTHAEGHQAYQKVTDCSQPKCSDVCP